MNTARLSLNRFSRQIRSMWQGSVCLWGMLVGLEAASTTFPYLTPVPNSSHELY